MITSIFLLSLLFLHQTKCSGLGTNLKEDNVNTLNYNTSSTELTSDYLEIERSTLKHSVKEEEALSFLTEHNGKPKLTNGEKGGVENVVSGDYANIPDISDVNVIRVSSKLNSWREERAEESPYSVMLFVKTTAGMVYCTGTLLTLEWVLTAATCLKYAAVEEVTVYAGGRALEEWLDDRLAQGSQVRKSAEHRSHPYYYKTGAFRPFLNVALVRAHPAFSLTDTVAPVELSTSHVSFLRPTDCKITSFGRVDLPAESKNYFRKTQYLSVETPCTCFDGADTDFWVCPESRQPVSLCKGDIGAGLICDGKIKAIVSQIVPVRDERSCDTSYPKYYDCLRVNNTINVFQGTCPYLRYINQYVKLFPKREIPRDCSFEPQETPTTKAADAKAARVTLTKDLLLLYLIYCLL